MAITNLNIYYRFLFLSPKCILTSSQIKWKQQQLNCRTRTQQTRHFFLFPHYPSEPPNLTGYSMNREREEKISPTSILLILLEKDTMNQPRWRRPSHKNQPRDFRVNIVNVTIVATAQDAVEKTFSRRDLTPCQKNVKIGKMNGFEETRSRKGRLTKKLFCKNCLTFWINNTCQH